MGLESFRDAIAQRLPKVPRLEALEDRIVASRAAWPLEHKQMLQGKFAMENLPSLVVQPENAEEAREIVRLALEHDVKLLSRGGASGLVGGTAAACDRVIVDTKRMRMFELNSVNLLVTAGAGWTGAELENRLNRLGYTLGHFPQSFQSAAVGGMAATRAIGTFSTKYGKMDDLVTGLEVVLPSGQVFRSHNAPKRSTGPELMELFLGSEGSYGIITSVSMKVYQRPTRRIIEAFTLPNTGDGLEAIRHMIQQEVRPAVLRLYDEEEAAARVRRFGLARGHVLLILAFEGRTDVVELERATAREICISHGAVDAGSEVGWDWFETRFNTGKIQRYLAAPGGVADSIEVAAPWDAIENVWRAMRAALEPYCDAVDCHFSHFYHHGASVYVIFHAVSDEGERGAEGLYDRCLAAAIEASVRNGGNVSHHHGVGIAKARFLPSEHGDAGMELMRRIKGAIDPTRLFDNGAFGI